MQPALLDQAWRLKEACYQAWHTEPAQARVLADTLSAGAGETLHLLQDDGYLLVVISNQSGSSNVPA